MSSPRTGTTEITAESTRNLYQDYDALGVDEKLALLYYIYEEMGDAVTPAAPNAADIELAQNLVQELLPMSEADQLEAMRSIVKREDTPLSRHYGGLSANNQLLVWYGWAQAMGNQVVDMPGDYEMTAGVKDILAKVKNLDFQEQITLLREAATQMGYSQVSDPPSQAETGKTSSL
jgi:hypothetical protein